MGHKKGVECLLGSTVGTSRVGKASLAQQCPFTHLYRLLSLSTSSEVTCSVWPQKSSLVPRGFIGRSFGVSEYRVNVTIFPASGEHFSGRAG